jgi:hypothetical protein
MAQDNSIVLVHADKSSGYGVAYGGPQNSPDMIVTALHLVAGKKAITVSFKGKNATARIEKIYTPSDLALLKLDSPLGITPLSLYPGDTPWDLQINFWEYPISATTPIKKITILEERTTLSKISPLLENEPAGLSKALCMDAGQYYPGMTTPVINFKEPNIRKAHSGSPLTYGDKILGMVDGGAKLVGGKPCVWAIPASDFNKLYSQGTRPSATMASCDNPTNSNKFMYCGIRSDNPMLDAEELIQAQQMEVPIDIADYNGTPLVLHHNYTMDFREVYETLFENEKEYLNGIFKPGDSLTLDHLLDMSVSLYVEEKTGISVVVPTECKFTTTTDAFGTLNTTSSPAGSITMAIYISQGETMDEGIKAMNSFKAFVASNGQAVPGTDNPVVQINQDTKYDHVYIEKKSS